MSIVECWFEDLFTFGDLKAVDGLVATDFVAHGQGGIEDSHGREAFREWLRWYFSTFAHREWTVHDIISGGDKIVACYSGRSTYKGGLPDILSSDQRVPETGILILRVEGGVAKEIWSEMSDLHLVMQLGAFPKPNEDR